MQIVKRNMKDKKVLFEQVKILYRVLLPIIAVNLVVSIAMLFGLWNVVSQTALLVWMSLMLCVLVARVASHFTYRYNFTSEHAEKYGLYFVIGTGLTGLLWGIGAVVLFPTEQLEYQLFILFILVGMGAGSVSSLTTYLPAFYAYFPISMLPVSVKMFSIGDPIHFALGMMTIAYIVALSYLGLNSNRTLIQSLTLRFENIDLVKQLREQKNEAELANISKSKFLAAASHDLRQPLHALTLFTSVLDESITYPKVRKVVDQIKSSVHALQSLFNTLLDISRLEAGVMRVEKTDFLLKPMLEKLANEYDPQAAEKDLHLSWSDCSFAVRSDATLVEQILRNYISNAIRYTDSGEVRVTCEANVDSLTIHVIDTGMGIPENEQKTIFEEFHQLSNPERDRSKGLGLGLAIVQRTAKLLEHAIAVESQPGKGSTFSITVARTSIEENTTDVITGSDVNNQQPVQTLLVVIDDEISVLEGTRQLLEVWDSDVITAADLHTALTQLRQQDRKPDGIIADYRLRGNQSGIDAINAIHAEYGHNIPALIVTGDIATERLRKVNNSGFQVLHKPVATIKLRAFLRHVQSRKARQKD